MNYKHSIEMINCFFLISIQNYCKIKKRKYF